MTNMECGGVQTSLLNFITALQKEAVEITLLFDDARGEWFNRIPSNVAIKAVKYPCEAFHKLIRPHRQVNRSQNIIYHILVHLIDRFYPQKENRNPRYTFLLKHIYVPTEKYDIAIDYHGYGFLTTSILAQKINAKKKAVFIHDENMACMKMAECDLKKIDRFYSVSKSCKRIFEEQFPDLKSKSDYFPNIIDVENIREKAKENIELPFPKKFPTFVTVGRVMYQKGYDFAVAVAEELKNRGLEFKWYGVGDGMNMEEINRLIAEKHLESYFIMLGRKDNPYPYINAADLYIQTSRHEGFGLSIAEALILGKNVLSTDIECVREQIQDGVNGFIEQMNVKAFADKIIFIISQKNKKMLGKQMDKNGIVQMDRILNM